MSRVLVIGCGGVASVAIRKCCQVSEVFLSFALQAELFQMRSAGKIP